MLIKGADDRSDDIAELNALLADPRLTPTQKQNIQDQLDHLEPGAWGEHEPANFLDFHFSGSDAHLILHDLRIVLSDGRTAQIHHLLVNSFQDFYLLESRNWSRLTVDETGACTTGENGLVGVPSPLERCQRHASVLERAVQIDSALKTLAPRCQIIPRVLVAPRCVLAAPHHQDSYVKADTFYSERAREIEKASFVKSVLDLPRHTPRKSLEKIGTALMELHNPGRINWREHLGMAPPVETNGAREVVASLAGLADHIPEYGDDWFILVRALSAEEEKTLNEAGYFAKEEKGSWVWRLRR